MAKDKADKAAVMARQKKLLEERYDLTPRPDNEGHDDARQADPGRPGRQAAAGDDLGEAGRDVARRDPREGAVSQGLSAAAAPQARRGRHGLSADGDQAVLPRLERFDLDFDLPEHFLPEFPPAIFLTTRPDLGDVSQGKVVTVDNFQEIFQGILNAKDLEGLRLLVTQFPQQQFNATADRKTEKPTACRAWPASTATSTATRRRRPTWWATSGRSRTAAASTRRACAA